MNQEVLKSIVVGNAEQKNLKNYNVSELNLYDSRTNHNDN
jgi:hypothetical protein